MVPTDMTCMVTAPDSKVNGANMGPIMGRKDPGGHHVGPMNFAQNCRVDKNGGSSKQVYVFSF